MNCYFHHQKPAVAMCKNCNRGVCPDCAKVTKSDEVVCSLKCEQTIAGLHQLVQRNRGALNKTAYSYFGLAAVGTLTGVMFVAFGLLSEFNLFLLSFGIIQLAGSAFMMFLGLSHASKPKPE